MKDLVEFRNELIQVEGDLDSGYRQRAFVDKVCEVLGTGEVAEDLVPCPWRGKGAAGRKLGVDAAAVHAPDGSVTLVLTIFDGSPGEPATITQSELSRQASVLSSFLEASLAPGLKGKLDADSPEEELRAELHQRAEGITKARLLIVTDMKLGDRVRELPAETVVNVPCEFHVWDVARLCELASTGHEPLEIDLLGEFSASIPCLPAQLPTEDYKSFLCIVPARVLADLYERFGARLLETNVRGFLSERGKVNRGIRATIQNRPHMFFAYNNGLTATAASVETTMIDGVMHIIRAHDLQIVNGGQTTASLFWARRKHKTSLDGVNVQMKLSVIPASMADKFDEIVSDISRFANSQNKVSDADLFSNHPFHREMEKVSRRVGASPQGGGHAQSYWFYERARAQYENERAALSTKQRKDFDKRFPKAQLITKTDMAKYTNCWEELPHVVSDGAQKNFRKFADVISARWDRNNGQFNEVFYKRHIAVAILYKTLERLIQKEAWYEGYRINIIAYTLATLSRSITRQGKRLNLLSIWGVQQLDESAQKSLVSIAKRVWDEIPALQKRSERSQWGNLGQWFKASDCWESVCDLDIPLPKAFDSLLVSVPQWDAQDKAGIKGKQLDDQIDAQMEVVRLISEGYWQRLRDWNQEDPVLSEHEYEAVCRLTSMPPSYVPKERDCSVLVNARQRAEMNGFA